MSPTELRIAGVPEHFNLPFQLGLERRAFIRAGIDLKWRTVPEGTGAMCDLLRKGEIDMAVLVTEGAVRDILNGNPSRIVSNYVDSPLTWGVHVGAKTALRKPEDLKGVPFAISRFNSGGHLMAMSFAKAQGWTLTEKDFVVVNNLKGALEHMGGSKPLAFLWEKATTSPWVDNGSLRCVDECRSPWPCFMLVARNEVLEAQSDAVRRVVKVVQDQARGLMEKKSAPEMVTQRYGMSVAAAKEWFGEVRWNTNGSVDVKALHAVSNTLFSLGLVEKERTKEELKVITVQPAR